MSVCIESGTDICRAIDCIVSILNEERSAPMELYAMKVNGLSDPIGYLLDPPVLSWKIRGAKGSVQTSARIDVSADKTFGCILWKISGTEVDCRGTVLQLELVPYTRYYCRITVASDAGETASGGCFFETAKLDQPWTAHWIGTDGDSAFHPEFRKQFSLRKDVLSARLYLCGLGLFEAYLGNEKVGDDLLAPFINDYQEHVQYCTYDVKELLKAENELNIALGNGWYRSRFGLSKKDHYERPFSLIAELRIVYADGQIDVIGTDESWEVRRGITTLSGIYDGETQDYFCGPGQWGTAMLVDAPAPLIERYSPPLTAHETLPVCEVLYTPAGETVLDFGQNFAGYVECTQCVPTGKALTIEFCEILQGGNFYHDNYRTAKSTFTYVSDGKRRIIRPRFTFFGFRYIKVSGLDEIDLSAFVGKAVYSVMDRTGWLETGNAKINRLHENTVWGLKSNFLDMPTDCPQRDERLGWTGDTNVFAPTAGYLMDTRAFYAKFLRDLRSDQCRNSGKIPIFLPNEFPGLCSAVWSDVATFLPRMLYDYYGDLFQLKRDWPLMRDWVDSVRQDEEARGKPRLWNFGFQFGDWLALDGATEQSFFGRTENSFIASLYYYASACCVAQTAKQLSYQEEAKQYTALACEIKAAILAEYFTPSGRLAIDTQTGYLASLKFGVYRDKQRLIDGLNTRMKKDCWRIKGGFVGATMMNTVLADNGLGKLAYDMLFYEGFPGWLYAVNLGATTIWERWNSVLPDGSISGTGMNSLNHYSYGAVIEFIYRYAAGIIPIEAGFHKVRIEPHPDIRLRWLKCSFDSAYGQYVSNWAIQPDGEITFHVEVPFDCTAELILPEQPGQMLDAGCYDFAIQTDTDYRKLYSADTPLEQLLHDKRATAVLEKYLPELLNTDRGDPEAMSKSLNDECGRAMLFGQSTVELCQAIAEISSICG